MKTLAKISMISLLAVVGLLLGGKASAADVSAQTQAQIQQIQEQIQEFTAQVGQLQGVPPKPQLTQAQLDAIQVQVDAIAAQVRRIAIEVQVLVTIRQIELKTAQLQAQVEMMNLPAAPAAATGYVPSTTAPAAADNHQQIETQAAQIKQQISELQQELAQKQAGEKETPTVSLEEPSTTTPVSGEITAQSQTAVPITVAAKPEKKSFWQMILDFFRNLFTF